MVWVFAGLEKQWKLDLLIVLVHTPLLLGSPALKRLGQQRLRLQGRPNELVKLGWLGPSWTRLTRNSSQLELEMTSLPKQQQPGWIRHQLELP